MKKLIFTASALVLCGLARAEPAVPAAPLAPPSPAVAAPTPTPSVTPTPAPTTESIERLLKAMDAPHFLSQLRRQLEGMTKAGFDQSQRGKTLTADEQAVIDAARQKLEGEFEQDFNWDKMKTFVVPIYASSFTQDEINSLIAFYESPTGKLVITKMPLAMQKTGSALQQHMGPAVQDVRKSIQDTTQKIDAMRKQKAALAATPAPASPAAGQPPAGAPVPLPAPAAAAPTPAPKQP